MKHQWWKYTEDDVLFIQYHVKTTCLMRKFCEGCPYYSDKFKTCIFESYPGEWRLEEVEKR